jgi:hypothetical protein
MKEPRQIAPFPSCISLSIEFNQYAVYYQTPEQWLTEQEDRECPPQWESQEDRQRAIDDDSIWICQWYPITPIGSYTIAASSFERLVAFASKIMGGKLP